MWKIIARALLFIVAGLLLAVGGLLAYLALTEYKPPERAALEVEKGAARVLKPGASFTALSFNIGYGGLGRESDFFMDGGEQVRPGSLQLVEKNLAGIEDTLQRTDADFYLLQEVDYASRRSYGLDERARLRAERAVDSAHALNYSCEYVPFPWPPIGRVHSGLYTMSAYALAKEEAALRLALPNPFGWPVRMANLKRCLLVNRVAIEGGERELVLVNLHLEAYDDGAGKAAQTAALMDMLAKEYAKGNYVVAGGDFNSSFPVVDAAAWPVPDTGVYVPGVIEADALPAGFQWAVDASAATCRLLNKPLDAPGENQFYVIDGFILSPNVALEQVQTLDDGFLHSDHNPVLLRARLLP